MKTEIIAILDKSGSMERIAKEAVQGYDQFIRDQAKLPGEARVSLVLFDGRVQPIYTAHNLANVPPLANNFRTGGYTALNDAIGETLSAQCDRIMREGWADKVIVVILTDGEENQSRKYNHFGARQLIEQRQREGWTFVFLAANQDAFATGESYGIAREYTANFAYDSAGATQAMAHISAATSQIRGTTY